MHVNSIAIERVSMLFEIKFKNKVYKIKKEVLIEVLSRLGCNSDNLSDGRIYTELKKRKLLDEVFLNNVQDLC